MQLPMLIVGEDGRFFVTEEGKPFFWLGDTAWELFHRLNREEALMYLENRASKGFNVVQAVALAELDGLRTPNAYGMLPLVQCDPARPAIIKGSYDYWDHVEFIVDEANRRGIYVGFLPTWGAWIRDWHVPPRHPEDVVFTEKNARSYGEFLGRRFGKKGIVWILGGDRPADGCEEVTRAMAAGITAGVTVAAGQRKPLMTFHPQGGGTSSKWFHHDEWLSFNMWQTGHAPVEREQDPCWERIGRDYAQLPIKPVLDGEPLYEDHPIGFALAREFGYSSDAHVRQRAYWSVFSGGCGVTYGNHAVWQMHAPGHTPVNGPLMHWHEALDRAGAGQMCHLRALMESRPISGRMPDQSLVVDTLLGVDHIVATRGADHAFVFTAQGSPFTVRMGKISGNRVTAWWFNPRSGVSEPIGIFENRGEQTFVPPVVGGLGADFVLVLDDSDAGFGAT